MCLPDGRRCVSSGEAKWIQNTIIGNLYSEYHQKLYRDYWTFLQDYQTNRSCVYSESLGILDSYQYEEVSKTYLCGQYLTRLMSTVNNGY